MSSASQLNNTNEAIIVNDVRNSEREIKIDEETEKHQQEMCYSSNFFYEALNADYYGDDDDNIEELSLEEKQKILEQYKNQVLNKEYSSQTLEEACKGLTENNPVKK